MENSFDVKAATWDENPRRLRLINDVTEVLFREIDFRTKTKWLDYGCGTGLLGFEIIDRVGQMVFCDTSEGMLNQVVAKIEKAGITNARICNADLSEQNIGEKFDGIVSLLVMHHIENIPSILNGLNQHLNSNAYLCIIDLLVEDGSFHSDEIVPHNGFDKEVFEGWLLQSGFTPVFYSTEIEIEKEVGDTKRMFPVFVSISQKASSASPSII
jgi:tRNA (cmo5U34)-methyltransferase